MNETLKVLETRRSCRICQCTRSEKRELCILCLECLIGSKMPSGSRHLSGGCFLLLTIMLYYTDTLIREGGKNP